MRFKTKAAGVWLGLFLSLGFGVSSARAQEEPSEPNREQPKPSGATSPIGVVASDDNGSAAPTTLSGPANPYDGNIRDAGTGLPLWGTSATPLRWGDFSVGSFQYIGIHDNLGPVGASPSTSTNLSILRTSLVFDHLLWKSRVVLQYLPQAVFVDGQFHANADSNNTLSLGTTFKLTPRLNLTVQDTFLQTHSNQLIPEHYLATDSFGGGVVQNNFLNSNGSFLANTASATLRYDFGPRTTLTASPSFRYSQSTGNLGPAQTGNYNATGQTYEGDVAISHALTPYRTIGVANSFQLQEESTTVGSAIARFNTTSIFYGQQLTRSWWINANVGASHQDGGGWGLGSSFSLNGTFAPRIGVALAFTRGLAFNNYVSTRRSDRVDASIAYRLTRRMSWTNSAGYFRELGSDPRTSGKYGTSGLSYNFFGNLSFFTNFTYTFQSSSTPQLLSGRRDTIVYGVLWQPGRVIGH